MMAVPTRKRAPVPTTELRESRDGPLPPLLVPSTMAGLDLKMKVDAQFVSVGRQVRTKQSKTLKRRLSTQERDQKIQMPDPIGRRAVRVMERREQRAETVAFRYAYLYSNKCRRICHFFCSLSFVAASG